MHWKTWLFARRMKKSEERFDRITDFPAHRAKRVALQQSEMGPRLFGTIPSNVSEDTLLVAGRRALIHRPTDVQGSLPVVVNFHGGGWVQGNPEQVRWLASEVAAGAGAVVVSPTYRLAPEHPYPAAVEDARDALTWVVEHAAELGTDPDRIAVMGDSAGGNLAAAVTLMARDAGGPPIRAQVLSYPVTDMYEIYPSEVQHAQAPILTSANMRTLVHLYLHDQYDTTACDASPMRASSHASLPPTLVVTAEIDILRDHGAKYVEALKRSGSPARLSEHRGAVHGFLSLPGVVPASKAAVRDIVAHLREHL